MKKSAVAFSTIIGICCLFIGNDVNGESVLFWMPFVFKSATLNYMPLAEELANRGHEVSKCLYLMFTYSTCPKTCVL
jgi:hypothetical protein